MRNNKPSRIASRSEKIGKKRKANTVYNILLGVVIIAIIVVGASIFLGDDETNQSASNGNNAQQDKDTNNDTSKDNASEDENTDSDKDSENASDDEDQESEEGNNEDENMDEEATDEGTTESESTVVENSGDPNVQQTLVNDSWEPVGTEQTGEHVADYTKGSTDWNEMEKALAYGAGLDPANQTVWFLGNGGSPNKAVGTVSPKDGSVTYRVYIEWIDGGGWKPVKVEQLKENDKR
jgi:cytoskeletal protein RodZ